MSFEHIGADAQADELLRAYEEGKSIDELNDMLAQSEGEEPQPPADEDVNEQEEAGLASEEPKKPEGAAIEEDGSEKEVKPFRTYQTQADFQKDFDRHLDKRFRKMKEAEEAKQKEFDSFKNQVAELLGVSAESALDELEARNIRAKAEREGVNPEYLLSQTRSSKEIERLKSEIEVRDRRDEVNRAIADIKEQGAAIKKEFPGFSLDEAMEDEAFRSCVFSLYNVSPESAVKRAFLACEGMGNLAPKTESAKAKRTIAEGAAKPADSTPVKKIDLNSISDKEVLELERRILNGENVKLE